MVSPTSPTIHPARRVVRSAPRRAGTAQDRTLLGEIVHFLGPAGLSVVVHLLLLFLLGLSGFAVGVAGSAFGTEFTARIVTQPISPSAAGSFHFPGRANIDRADSSDQSREPSEDSIQDLATLLRQESSFQMTPVDIGGSDLNAISVETIDRGDIVGTGGVPGSSADADAAGLSLGGRDPAGGGPVGAMWGVGRGQQARSIVYVMDRSGSMSDTFTLLQRELMRSIGALDSEQMFNIIWFNQGQATEWSARMRKATTENKRAAFSAIKNVVPEGQTEPMDAVRRALGFEPDVMFFLSDGDFGEDNEKVENLFRTRNRRKRTIVNTILFIYDIRGAGDNVLRSIAENNNGTFKHVTQEELNRS